jgi:hypothetical protein
MSYNSKNVSTYTWYNVLGDAPNITVTRRSDPKKKGTDKLAYNDKVLLVLKGGFQWPDVNQMTYAQYWAAPVGTYNFDQGIIHFVKALNTNVSTLEKTILVSKQATEPAVNVLLDSPSGRELLWKLLKGNTTSVKLTESLWTGLGVGVNVPKGARDDKWAERQEKARKAGAELAGKPGW